jgi:hypothetical protein
MKSRIFARAISMLLGTFMVLSLAASNAQAAGAVPALLNKTIKVSFTAQRTLRRMDGSIVTPSINYQQLLYVSSAGRIFVRLTGQSVRGTRTGEAGPDDTTTPDGDARSASFQGNKIVLMSNRGGGARRMVISFDRNYSGCSVDLAFGKPNGGPFMQRGPRGGMAELISTSFSGQDCSIVEGNAFAN